MTTTASPITLQQGEGEGLWFLGALGLIKAPSTATGGAVTVTEWLAPEGHASPLHVHHSENEWFYVLEGELTFWVAGAVTVAGPGAFVFGPRDVPHTFFVSSPEARFLVVTEPGGFEGFLRALSEPATSMTLPPASVQPPAPEAMMAAAAEYGIEILGPPGIPA